MNRSLETSPLPPKAGFELFQLFQLEPLAFAHLQQQVRHEDQHYSTSTGEGREQLPEARLDCR